MAKKAKLSPAAEAAAEARRGKTDPALTKLRALADGGDVAASAAAAEILAFRGEWQEAAARATVLLAKPDAVHYSNIFESSAAIVRRAAEVLKQPKLIKDAAKQVPEENESQRDAVLLADYFREREKDRTPNAKTYAEAVAEAPSKPRFKKKPQELARHCFSLAVVFNVDEAIIERWDPKDDDLDWEQAMEAARAFMRKKRPKEAWAAIASRTWWPVENTQVAPVELVTDFVLVPLMTRERCEEILSKPRGA